MILPCLDRLLRQLGDLEWLLREAGLDPERFQSRLSIREEQGHVAIAVVLLRRGRKIRIGPFHDPEFSAEQGIGQRHFWIDGNHWYDEFAVGILKDFLDQRTLEERQISGLCDLVEQAAHAMELGDPSPLLKAIELVRKSMCLRE